MTAPLAAAERARLNTWILQLVEVYLHSPAYTDTGDERRYQGLGLRAPDQQDQRLLVFVHRGSRRLGCLGAARPAVPGRPRRSG